MTTNFAQWNPAAANQENDTTYAGDSSRSGGAVSGPFSPQLANKIFYQVTTWIAAFAHALSAKGYSPVDGSSPQVAFTSSNAALVALAAVLSNILTNADIPFTITVGAQSGHVNFGSWLSNFKIQWGVAVLTNSGSPLTVTFPVAFTNTPNIMLTPQANISPFVVSPATATFGAEFIGSAGSYNVAWLAIGS